MALLAYDLAADGSAKFRKMLVDYAPQDGPDGLVCDVEGNLYVAVRDETRPGIYVYSPEGKELAYIKTEMPTNVGFGRGSESQDAVHHRGQERLSHPGWPGRIPTAGKIKGSIWPEKCPISVVPKNEVAMTCVRHLPRRVLII